MKCLSTRSTRQGLTRRRYKTPEDVRFTTIEVPLQVWNGVVRRDCVESRMASFMAGLARKQTRARGLALIDEGWKATAVAHELGVTDRAVQRWVRSRRGKK